MGVVPRSSPRRRKGRRRGRLTREEWIQAAWEALVDGGAEEVGVEPLARRMKVTKGSFY